MKKIYFLFCSIFFAIILHAQTFSGSTGIVHDYSTSNFYVTVSGLNPATIDTTNFGLENVTINLTHTYDSDLEIHLIAPDGTDVVLSSGNGGSGDNYTNTVFIDTASTSIVNGNAPFTGYFKPQGQMGLVNDNQNGNGVWNLRVIDMYPQDSGQVLNWSITFSNSPATYFSLHDSNLPIVVINTHSQSIMDSPKVMADMGIIYNGLNIRNHVTDPFNNYNGKIGIEFRGSSSQMFPKKSYGFELWAADSSQISAPILGMPPNGDWILNANYTDKSLMHNEMSYYLARKMGWYSTRCVNVEVVVDGQYQGVYILSEKIKEGSYRVNIPPLFPNMNSGDAVTGGYIFKIDKGTSSSGAGWTSPFAPAVSPNNQTIYFQYDYPADVNITTAQQNYLQSYVDSFETALAGPNFMDTTIGYAGYMNVNSFIDYFIINELSRNVDGYRLSTFLYKNRRSYDGGKIVIGPVWDYDIAWGNANYCNGSDTTGWAYEFGNVCSGDYWQIPFWWERLMQDPAFENKLRCRWDQIKQTFLSKNSLDHYCDSIAALLNESQQRNFTVWPIWGSYVWPEPSPLATNYQQQVDMLKNWINARWDWLDANIPGNLASCNLAGIDEQNPNENSAAFPNPFSNEIHLSIYLRDPQDVQLELYDATGKLIQPVQTVRHNGGTQTLTFSPAENLATGIYLLRIRAGDIVWTQRLSKAE